jgi:hypothetical protein
MDPQQTGHTIFAARDLFPSQGLGDARTAVSLPTLGKSLLDVLEQLGIGLLAWAGNPLAPLVKAAAGHCQNPAEVADRILRCEFFNHGIPFRSGSCESMPRDFFRISLSRCVLVQRELEKQPG